MNLPLKHPSLPHQIKFPSPVNRSREGKVRLKLAVGLVLVLVLSGVGIASLTGHLDFGRHKRVSYQTKPVQARWISC